METKLTKAEKKRIEVIEGTKKEKVFTPEKTYTLYDLMFNIGIKNKIAYFNMVERKVKKADFTIFNQTEIVKKVHDYGLIFNNGVQIKHVQKEVYSLVHAEVIEIRERL